MIITGLFHARFSAYLRVCSNGTRYKKENGKKENAQPPQLG